MGPIVDQYRFVVHPKDADGDYLVTCPAFGSEFSAFGSTPEEALREARTTLEAVIEVYQEYGTSPPEPDPCLPEHN